MGALTFGDAAAPALAMIARGRERGYVTRVEIDNVLPHGETDIDRIEDAMTALSELGIAVAEHEEPEDEKGGRGGPKELLTAAAVPERETGEDDHGRTDDPMALYFRDMGRRPLLTQRGEVALAQRIETGQRAVLEGLGQCLPAIRAVSAWYGEILDGMLALRDVIDVETTCGRQWGGFWRTSRRGRSGYRTCASASAWRASTRSERTCASPRLGRGSNGGLCLRRLGLELAAGGLKRPFAHWRAVAAPEVKHLEPMSRPCRK